MGALGFANGTQTLHNSCEQRKFSFMLTYRLRTAYRVTLTVHDRIRIVSNSTPLIIELVYSIHNFVSDIKFQKKNDRKIFVKYDIVQSSATSELIM